MGAKKESVNTFPVYYAWRNWINFFIKYTPEEDMERVAETFIQSVFEIVYGGYYRGEYNKAKTVMYAYDDALHGVYGKAPADKIFDIDYNHSKLQKLVEGKEVIYIENTGHEALGERVAEKILNFNPDVKIIYEPVDGVEPQLFIKLCNYIFALRVTEDKVVYIDEDENILSDSQDEIKVRNYNISKQAFMFSQKPLFMMLADKLKNSGGNV